MHNSFKYNLRKVVLVLPEVIFARHQLLVYHTLVNMDLNLCLVPLELSPRNKRTQMDRGQCLPLSYVRSA